ncbi:hypothetical protein [Ignavibacterium sp.]|uniref:YncE family protein n=1 Tax=Ignavibacterium sp. TaxID=2651167 RepID=UPI00260B9237|nr:hypothetical protein [Ignavibacterium sp.]
MNTKKYYMTSLNNFYNMFWVKILISVLFLFFASCDVNDVEDTTLIPLSEDAAVYLSMDGTAGLWILNANSLELIDSMITAPGVPWTIEFSPDYSTWYSCWGRSADYSIYSCNLRPLTITKGVQLPYAKALLIKSYDEKYLIAYGYKGIDIFDRASLSLIHQDTSSIFDSYSGIYASKKNNVFYFGMVENREFVGFGIYNLDSMKVIKKIKLFNSIDYPRLIDVDFVITPDDKFLFLSAWNWRGLGGFGSFFIIDLTQERIINEFQVGAFSQLAISPDGQSIYISDPGGHLYNFPSSGKVWRYDVKSNTMGVLINNLYYSDRITVAEDNRTLFITPTVAFDFQNGVKAWLVKADALNGQIIDYYPVSYDSMGFYTNIPRNVRMGKYITANKRR